MTLRHRFSAFAVVLALVWGSAVGYIDSRPTWDDTGVTVGALVIAAGILGALAPRRWWAVGLLVGVPVVVANHFTTGRFTSVPAIAFALVGAAFGPFLSSAAAGSARNRCAT